MWLTVWRSELLTWTGMCSQESGYWLCWFEDVNYQFNTAVMMMFFSLCQLKKHLVCLWQTVLTAYLEIWRRSGWWAVWVEHWQPADQTPCCCVQLPDTAPPFSWNSRSGLWFGKPADPHLAGNQQRQDRSPDEQREGAAKPLLFNFQKLEAPCLTEKRFSCLPCMLNTGNTIYSRFCSLNERVIIM